MNTEIKNVAVFGAGVLGSQIAFQTAFHGFNVVLCDISRPVMEGAKTRISKLAARYMSDLNAKENAIGAAMGRLSYSIDMSEAVSDADLAIEAIPENVAFKKDFYRKLGEAAPEKTIFATNSSTLLPSMFAEDTGRPERFLALHFANEIWKNNTAEIMGHPGTAPEIFDAVTEFAQSIGMVALPIHKEQPGYILNTLLVPFLDAAIALYADEVADPETIDKTWMIATGAPKGPFGIYDVVGITTAHSIISMKAAKGDFRAQKATDILKERFINTGKLGVAAGEGFYKYPNPAYSEPDFLTHNKIVTEI